MLAEGNRSIIHATSDIGEYEEDSEAGHPD